MHVPLQKPKQFSWHACSKIYNVIHPLRPLSFILTTFPSYFLFFQSGKGWMLILVPILTERHKMLNILDWFKIWICSIVRLCHEIPWSLFFRTINMFSFHFDNWLTNIKKCPSQMKLAYSKKKPVRSSLLTSSFLSWFSFSNSNPKSSLFTSSYSS